METFQSTIVITCVTAFLAVSTWLWTRSRHLDTKMRWRTATFIVGCANAVNLAYCALTLYQLTFLSMILCVVAAFLTTFSILACFIDRPGMYCAITLFIVPLEAIVMILLIGVGNVPIWIELPAEAAMLWLWIAWETSLMLLMLIAANKLRLSDTWLLDSSSFLLWAKFGPLRSLVRVLTVLAKANEWEIYLPQRGREAECGPLIGIRGNTSTERHFAAWLDQKARLHVCAAAPEDGALWGLHVHAPFYPCLSLSCFSETSPEPFDRALHGQCVCADGTPLGFWVDRPPSAADVTISPATMASLEGAIIGGRLRLQPGYSLTVDAPLVETIPKEGDELVIQGIFRRSVVKWTTIPNPPLMYGSSEQLVAIADWCANVAVVMCRLRMVTDRSAYHDVRHALHEVGCSVEEGRGRMVHIKGEVLPSSDQVAIPGGLTMRAEDASKRWGGWCGEAEQLYEVDEEEEERRRLLDRDAARLHRLYTSVGTRRDDYYMPLPSMAADQRISVVESQQDMESALSHRDLESI